MNERIKELYNQCFVELKNDVPNVGFDFEKFAESIIKECIKKYDEYGLYSSDQRSFIIAGHNVKKHFGLGNHD